MNKPLEEGLEFTPRYDDNGLIPCIVTDAASGDVLMMAYMNDLALGKTIQTGEAHYWSRSRNELWHKGATSSAIQRVISIRTDCDRDCLLMAVEVQGSKNSTCHTGRNTCFYRELDKDSKALHLKFISGK